VRSLPAGHYVKYQHNRLNEFSPDGSWARFSPTGGTTVARIYNSEDQQVAAGEARCSPSEQFNRRLGRDIALGRALAQLDGTMVTRIRRYELGLTREPDRSSGRHS